MQATRRNCYARLSSHYLLGDFSAFRQATENLTAQEAIDAALAAPATKEAHRKGRKSP